MADARIGSSDKGSRHVEELMLCLGEEFEVNAVEIYIPILGRYLMCSFGLSSIVDICAIVTSYYIILEGYVYNQKLQATH